DAHPWLRARCQQTSREPQKRCSGLREYPELQLNQLGMQATSKSGKECKELSQDAKVERRLGLFASLHSSLPLPADASKAPCLLTPDEPETSARGIYLQIMVENKYLVNNKSSSQYFVIYPLLAMTEVKRFLKATVSYMAIHIRDETIQRLQRDVLLSHQARDSQAAQLDIQEQGSLSRCLNCRRAAWISGEKGSCAAIPKAASEPDSAGPGPPVSAAWGILVAESTQVGHRCKDLEAELGQRPTSVIQCQDRTEDTRSRVRQPPLGSLTSLPNPSSTGSGTDYCFQTPEERRPEQGGGWRIERDASTEEKILALHVVSNMAASLSRYSSPNSSDLSQQNH
ncbi:hypothetical protein L3Q82_009032, partial [Scortum barcoo]